MAFPTQTEPISGHQNVSFERERGVYAIEVMSGVSHAVIQVGEDAGRTGRISRVLSALAGAGVPVFLIKMHRDVVTLAFAGADTHTAIQTLSDNRLTADVRGELALVVVRAASMRDLHGIMVNIADALFDAGARLHETGDSHNSVQCLIEESRTDAAVESLCKKFELSPDAVSLSTLATGGAR